MKLLLQCGVYNRYFEIPNAFAVVECSKDLVEATDDVNGRMY